MKPVAKAKLLTIDDIDGRTSSARAARDLMADITADLGGSDMVSTAEKQIIQRAAITGAILESMEAKWLAGGQIDMAVYVPLANLQRRHLEAVGLKRQPKPVETLQQYLEAKKNEAK
jgi:hypothetical protein